MGVIELAERKAQLRAYALYIFAGASLVLLTLTVGTGASPFLTGLWLGLTLTAALYLTPLFTRLKNSPLARLLDDETTRDHRRASSVAGLWPA